MKYFFTFLFLIFFSNYSFADYNVMGAGATFPYGAYTSWAYFYNKDTKVRVNYQGIGSGGGIRQVTAETVDFGASDDPLSHENIIKNNFIQFPALIGGVVIIVNIDGIKENQLILTAEIISDIYMGKITKWNDAKIVKLNANLKLPNDNITVVSRSDSSGTTAIFTNYLYENSKEWAENMGKGKSINWKKGISGKGNDGVASYVKQIKNSIGYVEFAYAKSNNIAYTKLINKSGYTVSPTTESFSEAAKNAKWDKNSSYSLFITNSEGEKSWPISGATFIIVSKNRQKSLIKTYKFFEWSFNNGDKIATELFYVPLPKSLQEEIKTYVKGYIKN